MRNVISLSLLATILMSFSSCIVVPGPRYRYRTHHRPHRAAVVRQGCPPAHHWNGFACVHNGRGNGRGIGRR
jgi:hypothetical protein